MNSQLMVVFANKNKRSEIVLENSEYTVNFYIDEIWKHSSKSRVYNEALRLAETFTATKQQLLNE
jgi:hypothetical protein